MRLELGLLVAVMASLGLKVVVNDYRVDIDHASLTRDLGKSLAREGYAFEVIPRTGRPPSLLASAGLCRVFVQSAYSPASLSGAYIRDFAAVGKPVYRIGTTEFANPPSARIWMGDVIQYSLGRIGVTISRPAPIVIALSQGCRDAGPDLSALRLGTTRKT